MLDRRSFLRRTSLAIAGGLIVGDQAMEMFERLTHRKVFTGAFFGRRVVGASLTWDKAQDRPIYCASLNVRWNDGTVQNTRQLVTPMFAYDRSSGDIQRQLTYSSVKMVQGAQRETGQDILAMIRPQLSGLRLSGERMNQ